MMNLVSRTVEKSSMSLSSSASNSPRTLKAQSQNLGLIACAGRPAPKDSNEDAASSSQAWQSDGNLNSSAGRLAPTGKSQRVIDRDWPRNFEISASVVEHLEKVNSNFRQKIGLQPEDEILDLNVNSLMWRMFMLGDGCSRSSWSESPREFTSYQKHGRKKDKTIVRRVTEFDFESRRNIRDIKMDWDILPWQRTTIAERQGSPTVDSKSIRLL